MPDFQPDLAMLDRVFNQAPGVKAETPADWQQQAARAQAAQALAQEQRAKAQKAAQEQAAQARAQELAQLHGGDPDKILADLERENPTFANTFREQLAKGRDENFKALKSQNDYERALFLQDLAKLEAASADPVAYAALRPDILKRHPDMAALLPEQHNPVAIGNALKAGLTVDEIYKRRDHSIQLAVDGKWHQSIAMALDDPEIDTAEEWNSSLEGQRIQGAPAHILAQFGAFSPENKARVRLLGMTPAQRATAEKEGALVQVEGPDGTPIWATRDQAVGQPVGTRPASEGALVQVVGPGGQVTWQTRANAEGQPAPRPAAGGGGDNSPLQAVIGPDGQPVLVRRNEAVGKRPATATMGAGGGGELPPRVETTVRNLAGAFRGEAAVKRAVTMGEAVSFVSSLDTNTKNPADDQALIYAFAKAMDPESVVREGEYATVAKYAQSWLSQFGFDAMRVLSSNTPILTPQARANLKKTITGRFNASRGTYDNLVKSYVGQINKATGGDDGMERLTDYGAVFPPAPGGAAPEQTRGGGAAKPGAVAAPTATPKDFSEYLNRRRGGP